MASERDRAESGSVLRRHRTCRVAQRRLVGRPSALVQLARASSGAWRSPSTRRGTPQDKGRLASGVVSKLGSSLVTLRSGERMGLFLLFVICVVGIAVLIVWLRSAQKSGPPLPTPAARAASLPAGAQWVSKDVTSVIAGRSIAGGLYYLGRGARAAGGYRSDPPVIDPSLPVNWQSPDWAGATMGYWPSYDQISPRCRAAYLSFLNSDRSTSDPSSRITNIGYVFLLLLWPRATSNHRPRA